ncbi:MAG: HesB/IscA family protein [Paracoccaceae bacterium]
MHLPPKVTNRAFKRLREINAANEGKALRIAVEGGGCSGFQYEISLGNPTEEDLVIESDGEKVIIDAASLPFLENAIIDYADELIGARFVIENPNATSSCGCGTSFSI